MVLLSKKMEGYLLDNIDVRMLTKRYVMNIVWTTVMLTERPFYFEEMS